MTRPHRYEYDGLSRLNSAKSMNDPSIIQAMLSDSLINNFRNNSLGHTRVMFECHLFDTIALVEVAHGTDKHSRSPHTRGMVFGTKLRFKSGHKLPRIEDILLDAYLIHIAVPINCADDVAANTAGASVVANTG